jgi:gluconokinase
MFPVFKLAAHPPGRGNRVGSPKAWLSWELSGSFVEDYGMASASGLVDVQSGKWDSELVHIAGLESEDLPIIVEPDAIVGTVTEAGASRFGIPTGTRLVSGSGDGFLANIGSGCATSKRIAVTLGTSGVVRRMLSDPRLNAAAGTFCYRARADAFLLGCASNNGGNVLDWARETYGPMAENTPSDFELPTFLPFMNGERSIEWDPNLRESWYGRLEAHTPAHLSRAVTEGVLFNIAQYVEVVERESGIGAQEIILSGNAFSEPQLAPLLASLLGRELWMPRSAGLATLRGAGIYTWRTLGHDAEPALEKEIQASRRVKSLMDSSLMDRFARFKELRKKGAA